MVNTYYFNTHRAYIDFEKEVKSQQRFVRSKKTEQFLSTLASTLSIRERRIVEGATLYRSQIGYEEFVSEGEDGIRGFPSERMKPVPEFAQEGRANPKGIAYLYLSNDMNTSMAELRPHAGEIISCAQFQIKNSLSVIDCYSNENEFNKIRYILNPPDTQEEITLVIWQMINDAFTKPVTNNDSISDYVPTQILAELFKARGYDGVCCKSYLGLGHNFILFDLNSADLIECYIKKTKAVSYNFEDFDNPCNARKPT